MEEQQKRPSAQKPRGGRWAARILIVLAVPSLTGTFFLLKPGSQVATGSKPATTVAYVRKETRPTLSPARFVGKAARAHEVAQEIPEILDQLHCYCDCEKHMNHRSLLSCYTDGHAGSCDICIEETLEASRLYQQGKDVEEIRTSIDRQFGRS